MNGQCSLKGCYEHATTCWSGNDHSCVPVCAEHIHAQGAVGYDNDREPWLPNDPTKWDENGMLID